MKTLAVLCLESGGTKLVAGVSDAGGKLLHTVRMDRNRQNRAIDTVTDLITLGSNLVERFQQEGYEFRACGFGFGGSVARSSQSPYLCLHEEGWNEIDARRILETKLNLSVYIENDCKVAALAEALLGAGSTSRNVFYMTIGTGIGGGFVRNKQVLALAETGEAEVGHLPLEPNGPVCGCGGFGCLEALASGPGILLSADGAFGSTEEIFRAWEAGDHKASAVVEKAARYIARGIACVMALYHPDCIVLGGGVASGNPRFVERISQLAKAVTVTYFRDDLAIRVAALGENVVIQGAALFALQQLSLTPEPQ